MSLGRSGSGCNRIMVAPALSTSQPTKEPVKEARAMGDVSEGLGDFGVGGLLVRECSGSAKRGCGCSAGTACPCKFFNSNTRSCHFLLPTPPSGKSSQSVQVSATA